MALDTAQLAAALENGVEPVILVVEDEWLVRMVVVDSLRESGRTVVEAASGAEAVQYIQSGAAVDLIFTDVRMPGLVDGLALLEFAKRTIPGVPVIMSSGHLDPALALQSGASGFISKPYCLDKVQALIGATLAASQ